MREPKTSYGGHHDVKVFKLNDSTLKRGAASSLPDNWKPFGVLERHGYIYVVARQFHGNKEPKREAT